MILKRVTNHYNNTFIMKMSLRSLLIHGIVLVPFLIIVVFVILPFILATITVLRQKYDQRLNNNNNNNNINNQFHSSALYVGRVWHTRFRPIQHSFTYPIFIFGLNLDEIYRNDSIDHLTDTTGGHDERSNECACTFQSMLWPLSWIVSFNPNDHLKNGEGNKIFDGENAPQSQQRQQQQQSFPDRIYRFIAEKTGGSFQPNHETHSIYLVTHLTYYRYCFNPVSFYYIHERNESQELVCVIGEVSNTPWNEMYCYVLHPRSTDQVQCRYYGRCATNDSVVGDGTSIKNSSPTKSDKMKYIFPKKFHVSPFMEMTYDYEWVFTNFCIDPNPSAVPNRTGTTTVDLSTTSIHIINNLRPTSIVSPTQHTTLVGTTTTTTNHPPSSSSKRTDGHNELLQFSAILHVHRCSMHPYRIVYYMIMYPMYCMMIQIWIHIQAFYLFTKGITYQPHPLGSETMISRCIGCVMEPFFYIRDQYMKTTSSTSTTPTSSSSQKNKVS